MRFSNTMFTHNPAKSFTLAFLIATPVLAKSFEPPQVVSWETEVHFSGIADSKFKSRSFRGDVSAIDFGARAVASRQFGGSPLFRMGVEWQRCDFSLPRRAPLPDKLQSLALVVGADFQIGDAWLFRLEATPGTSICVVIPPPAVGASPMILTMTMVICGFVLLPLLAHRCHTIIWMKPLSLCIGEHLRTSAAFCAIDWSAIRL